jgi:type IV pilus assembly protein PilW
MKHFKINISSGSCGFSLVELLVAMAIALVVMAGVFQVYVTQQDTYLLQEQVAEMQQNARTARYIMTREIRMAGYDPTGLADAGFVSAYSDSIRFTMDIIAEDGTITVPGDDITYSVSTDAELQRNEGSGDLAVAENIEAIGFAYAFDADSNGSIDTSGGGNIIWAIDSDQTDGVDQLDKSLDTNDDGVISIDDNPAGVDLATPVPVDRIRAVRLWILASTSREDTSYSDNAVYVLSNQRVNPNDGNRRYLMTTTIKCRNLAL